MLEVVPRFMLEDADYFRVVESEYLTSDLMILHTHLILMLLEFLNNTRKLSCVTLIEINGPIN